MHEAVVSTAIVRLAIMGGNCLNLSHLGIQVELIMMKSSRHVILLLVDMLDGNDISSITVLVVLSAESSS